MYLFQIVILQRRDLVERGLFRIQGKGTSAGASGGNTWILCVVLCFYWAVIIGH